ncbi:MAG: alkaline phosphatase family protein [Candidatus Njordarchaeales archaeon]
MSLKGLIIVLDGLDKELFEKANMVFLKKMYHKGIKSVKPTITPACAVSILTGMEPKKHGIVDFYDTKFNVVTAKNVHYLYFTDILKLWGYRLGIWKVPMIYPKKYQGFVVWGLEAPRLTDDHFIRALLKKVKYNPEEMEFFSSDKKFYEIYKKKARLEFSLFKFLAKSYNIDVGFFWFRYTDILAHSFYGRRNDLLIDYYNYIDELIKNLIEDLKPNFWIVFGDHGFAEKKYTISIPRLLIDADLIHWSKRYQHFIHLLVEKTNTDTIIKLGLLKTYGFLSFVNMGSYVSGFFRFNEVNLVGAEDNILTIVPYKAEVASYLERKLGKLCDFLRINSSLVIVPQKGIGLTKIVLSKPIITNKSTLRRGIHWIDTVVVSNDPGIYKVSKITDIKDLILSRFRKKLVKLKRRVGE